MKKISPPSRTNATCSLCGRPACFTAVVIVPHSVGHERRPYCFYHGSERQGNHCSRVEPILCEHRKPVDAWGECQCEFCE